jgi:transcriptional regulator with XRE-family HTH domain
MADGSSPLVLRRRLRTELRDKRLEKNLTQEQVAKAMDWSLSKMIRIDSAQTSISINDLRALLRFYEITDRERTAELIRLARAARKQGWWRSYSTVAPKELLTLIDYESAASSVRQFETTFIPGILQTREYARAVLQNFYPDEPAAELVQLRTKREDLLRRDGAPQFFFILDEPVIERLAGGPSVMRLQLQRLIDATELPNVTIQVVPLSAGLHPGVKGPFEFIRFPDPADKDVVFLETRGRDVISDSLEETENYLKTFERLEKVSLSPADSAARINELIKGMA